MKSIQFLSIRVLHTVVSVVFVVVVIIVSHDSATFVTASSTTASMGTETIIGIVGNDFIMIASDTSIHGSNGISLLKSSNVDKIHLLNNIHPYQNTFYSTSSETNTNTQTTRIRTDNNNRKLREAKEKIVDDIIIRTTTDYDEIDNDNPNELRNKENDNSILVHKNNIQKQNQQPIQDQLKQQTIVGVGIIGNYADSERLINWIQSYTTINEYIATKVGCDVTFIDCSNNANNKNNNVVSSLSNINNILSVNDIASIVRLRISNSLRSSSPLNVCLLIGGMMIIDSEQEEEAPSYTSKNSQQQKQKQQQQRSERINYPSRTVQEQLLNLRKNVDKSLPIPDYYEKLNDIESSIITTPASQSTIVHDPRADNDEEIVVVEQQQQQQQPQQEKFQSFEQDDEYVVNNKDNNILKMKPCLYWLDEYGSKQLIQYGCHGLGSLLIISILDKYYTSTSSTSSSSTNDNSKTTLPNKQEAISLIKKCYTQLYKRYIINTQSSSTSSNTCDRIRLSNNIAENEDNDDDDDDFHLPSSSSSPSILIKCIDQYGCHTITI